MCYDLSFSFSIESVSDYLKDFVVDPQMPLNFEGSIHMQAQAFQKQPIALVENGRRVLKEMEWGVISDYMNTPDKIRQYRSSMCNARAEKILDKQAYWYRIRHQRCLIPMEGVYEHREVKGWKNKVPYYIWLKERELFCIPGLYNYAVHPQTGETIGTYTLITRPANEVLRQIHNCGENAHRMPLFLTKDLEQKWIEPDLSDTEIADILDFEIPSEELAYHAVYTIRTSKMRPDGKPKNAPYEWAGLPPLGQDSVVMSLF